MRVLRETGHGHPVIHAPAVQVGEIGAEVAAGQRPGGPEGLVAFRVVVDVMNGEDERVEPLPGKPELYDVKYRGHGETFDAVRA